MTYSIERSKRAAKYFVRADKALKEWFLKRAGQLQANPTDSNTSLDIKAMEWVEHIYRLRIGSYRIVYEVYHDSLVILMLDIDSRGDIYKRR